MTIPIAELKNALMTFLNQQDLSKKKEDILVSFAYKITEINITSLIDPLLAESKKVFYFNRPEEDITFLAFEEAISLKIKGMNQFTTLGEKISVISKNLINNWDKVAAINFPLFLGGNKFYTGKNSDEWNDFADNDWFIPQFLFYKKNNKFWFVYNYLLNNNNFPSENSLNCLFEPIDRLNNKEHIFFKGFENIQIHQIEKEKEKWNDLISNALFHINESLFSKVVISRRIIADIKQTPSYYYILTKLEGNYQNCSVFLYSSKKTILIGATPEHLLKLKGNELQFDALAGSSKRGDTEREDNKIANNLLVDKKNAEEHNHVIEFIKDASSPYVKNLRQSDTVIKKFSNIQHLYTPIRAELKSCEQIYQLVDAIFPTPAICGYPKENSYKYITDNEKFDRGLFSGIIGFISSGEMDLVVAIRSALLKDEKIYIYAGCGIVKGSDPVSEFEETEIKMNPILSLFKNEN